MIARMLAFVPLLLVGASTVTTAIPAPASAAATPELASLPENAGPGATVTVAVIPVRRQPMQQHLTATGVFVARDELPISAETNNLRITEVAVDEGDSVTAGQVLLRLNDADLQAQRAQQIAAIRRADATIAQEAAAIDEAVANVSDANSNVQRGEALLKTSAITAQTAESRRTTLKTAEARLAQARHQHDFAIADAESARAALAEIDARLAQTVIRAPAAGLITKRVARLGQVPGNGAELFRILRDGLVEFDAEIPEDQLAAVSPGQIVRLAAPEREGWVRAKAPVVDRLTHVGLVHVAFKDCRGLVPGMFVRGTLILGDGNRLVVPEAAILAEGAKTSVFRITAAGRAERVEVVTGARADGQVEILSGLKEGETVATDGAGWLKSGDAVRIGLAAR